MSRFEIAYRENGVFKCKGFGYRKDLDRFVARMSRKENVDIIEINVNGEDQL